MDLWLMLLGVALTLTPGAWLSFTLGAGLPFSSRIGLALALSPFVLGAAILTLTSFGLSFFVAAIIAAIASLPSAALVWMRRPRTPIGKAWIAPALCFAVIAGAMIAMWALIPSFRAYSWHNMMQLEAVYQAARLPQAPEEMGLAGADLNYAWFGHIQIAAIARLADASPLLVFPIANIAALLGLFLLVIDSTRRLAGERLALVSFVATAALLSTNLAGALLDYSGGGGDVRTDTPLHKFLHFDLMGAGLTLFFATMLMALHNAGERKLNAWLLMLAALTAVGLIYPLLFPAAFAVAGALLVMPVLTDWWSGRGFKVTRGDLIQLALLALPLAIWALYLRALSGGLASVSIALAEPWQIRQRIFDGAWKLSLVYLPFVLAAAWRAFRDKEGIRLALFAAGASVGAIYLVSVMPEHVEYKFGVAALLCLLPLAAEQAMRWLDKLGRAALPAAAITAALIFAAIAPHMVEKHVPWRLMPQAEALNETHFAISARSPALAWTTTVREQTPPDTILVHPVLAAPVAPLTQRAAFITIDNDVERPGYTMSARGILQNVKGYPAALLDERTAAATAAYAHAADFAAVDRAISALERPYALYLAPDSAFLAWLRQRARGRAIYGGADGVVWLEPPVYDTASHL